jgi:hypothetical protein
LAKNGVYSFLSFDSSFEFHGFLVFLEGAVLLSNAKAEIWPFLLTFGAGMRATEESIILNSITFEK